MVPANLVVLSLMRAAQAVLCIVLFVKVFKLQVPSSIELFCNTTSTGIFTYAAQYPFTYIHAVTPASCKSNAVLTDTFVWTGMGPTVVLYTVLSIAMVIYPIASIIFYVKCSHLYDVEKKYPAADLLASLVMGALWGLDCYLAWYNFPSLKEVAAVDSMITSIPVCAAYCSSQDKNEFTDMNVYLFLGLACALSWGICVWFIFMESGLCPEDEEDDMTDIQSDFDPRHPNQFIPFPHQSKDQFKTTYGLDSSKGTGMGPELLIVPVTDGASAPNMHVLDEEKQQQLFLEYLNNWKGTGHLDAEECDRFSQGYTFNQSVPSISEEVHSNEVDHKFKVHSKWNLFKA